MKPIQDLHGYSAPWIGGEGSNKLDFASASATRVTVDGTADNFTLAINASGNAVLSFSLPLSFVGKTLYLSGELVRTGTHTIDTAVQLYTGGSAYTPLAYYTENALSLSDLAVAVPADATSLALRIDANLDGDDKTGETVTVQNFRLCTEEGQSWSPYENICPIYGCTGAALTRAGKNLLHNTKASAVVSGVTITVNEDGSVLANGTASGNATFIIPFSLPAGNYYFNGCPADGETGTKYSAFLWDMTANTFPKRWDGSTAAEVDIGDGSLHEFQAAEGHDLQFELRVYSGFTAENLLFKPMICADSETDPAFEAYRGDTYSVDWTDEAGIVYGGTLDFVSGLLTVTQRSYAINGSIAATGVSPVDGAPEYTRFFNHLAGSLTYPAISQSKPRFICDSLPTKSGTTYNIAESSVTSLSSYPQAAVFKMPASLIGSDAASIAAYLQAHPIQIVVPLETPVTYQLTPQEINTLLGQNNLWADLTVAS